MLSAQSSLQDSAWVLLDKGDFSGAQKFIELALLQYPKLKVSDKADLLNAKAVALRRSGNPRRAITVHYLALKNRENAFGRQSLPVARSWQNIGNCWIDLQEPFKANNALQNALKAAQYLDDPDIKVKILQSLGGLHQAQKQLHQAVRYYRQALAMQRTFLNAKDPSLQNNLLNLAQCLLDQHNTKAALPYIQQLEKLLQPSTGYLCALRLRANIAQQSGDLTHATQLLRKALAKWEQNQYPDTYEWLHNLMDLASVLEQKRELDEAGHLFTQLLYKLEQKPDLKAFRASIHNNYANLLRNWGRDSSAVLHYEQAIGLFSIDQKEDLNAVYLNLASIYLKANDLTLAQIYLNLISPGNVSTENQLVAQLLQGQLYQKAKKHTLAKETFTAIYQQLTPQRSKFPELFANASVHLADLYRFEQNFTPARSTLRLALQALGQTEKLRINLRPSETSVVLNAQAALTLAQAQAQPNTQHWTQAWYAHRRTIEFFQQHQQQLTGKYSLLLASAGARSVFEGMLEVCNALSEQNPRFAREAFLYADLSKALLLRRLMQDAHAKSFAGVNEKDVQQETALQNTIHQLNLDLQMASHGGQRSQIEAKLGELEEQKRKLIQQLEKKYPRYHQLKYASAQLRFSTLQTALSPKQSLLAYFLSQKFLYVFVLNRERFHFEQIRIDSTFFRRLDSCYTYLHTPPTLEDTASLHALTQQSHALYKVLVRPVEMYLKPEVSIIPDAQLHYLPFDALLYAEARHLGPIRNFPFLLKRHAFHYLSSATLLNQEHPVAQRTFFLATAPRFVPAQQGLSTLPNAQEEVERIGQGFRTKKLLIGDASTEASFVQLAPRASVIHLATHGIVDNRQPDFSYLAFADHRPGFGTQGRLTAAEVYGLRLRADLVFLGACQTGLGQWYASEGMLSLSRAFYYAGAKSLVATLWSIPDFQTAQVSEHFYTALHQQQPKNLALQQAKLTYLQNAHSIRAHPAFWAAFTLSGDLSPLPRAGFLPNGGYALLLLLLLGIAWYCWRRYWPNGLLLRNR